ncbi:fatty acid metabolism transcriptional regulator FadR [Psychrobium sp. 1_MG-2023]|uniref:fatty acid metabolism transcriptional regulator FadR n=1 Tax=Psychrobium sp. 1_MG-2023 TaxID=3062624 RepID=UPI000C32007F|nr:fatty acid metabolism transcriptional regulator FadR [Psychrobium sp. 1_MG-2023]MDP2562204.1 fatty acid metabolism transcriptional regulator FadR [Psychrobium sp. 1_MG-2023]PKF58094.1 fatty acid metabolism transcriptional regulator FadR [Alteromonadales bacterium alter-6D02]
MIYKAQSPAGFAEEYLVDSIWTGRFPPGSFLPAERELSELIGVTRTTLREVLQRLSRDGWLQIQHGKPTKVNNYWETAGLNVLVTMARLDQRGIPELVDQLLSARTNVSVIYIRAALKNAPEKSVEIIKQYKDIEDSSEGYSNFDYQLHHELAFASGNPIYVLILNGFKDLYSRVGKLYFELPEARRIADSHYEELISLAEQGEYDQVILSMRRYGLKTGKLWQSLRERLPTDIVDPIR